MRGLVVLVNANRMEPLVAPIGLEYVAEALAAEGWDVDVIDAALADTEPADAIRSELAAREPDVVGVTFRNTDDCFLASRQSFLPELRGTIDAVRQSTGAPIVLGGAGFSVMPEALLDFAGLDVGVWGEGEASFGLLAGRLVAGEQLDDVPNLVIREEDGWRRTPVAYTPLSLLPPRTRRFVDNRAYFERGGQGGVETKRGCAQPCIYCADPVAKGRTQRLRSPRTVATEMEALVAQGVDCLHICDSEFNLPEKHAKAICHEIVARGLGERITWYAYAGPVPFSDELAGLMKAAGCVGIDFGADSGSDEQLARLGRRFSCDDLMRTAESCRKTGITFMYDVLLGAPGETRETLAETIDVMKMIEPDRVGLSVGVRLYPGTQLAKMVQDDGFGPGNRALHGATTGNPGMALPVFYVSEQLGDEMWGTVSDLVGDDPRFFFTDPTRPEQNYNYNDNRALVEAIADGARGAYWDILRRMAGDS